MTDETTNAIRLEGLTLPVADLARSLAFYRDLLGFAVTYESPAFALVRIGDGSLGLLRAAAPGPAGPRANVHVELSTDDLDGLYDELTRRGAAFSGPPTDRPWERAVSLLDPDGYRVEFAQGRRDPSR